MNAKDYLRYILPKTIAYHAVRRGLIPPVTPMTLTFSITAACQSLCRTCNIGQKFREDPGRRERDLTLEEIERIFRRVGRVYFFNISGGEPFLRKDLPQIIELACRHLRPRIIHTPTNAIDSEQVRDLTRESLAVIRRYDPQVPFTVKPSIDGVGERHDAIRGAPGNFAALQRTIADLKLIEAEDPHFHLELGTVISNFNAEHLSEIEEFVHAQGIQSYRNEIAEQRAEFFNQNDPITPDAATYEKLVMQFAEKIRRHTRGKHRLTRVSESLRLTYYELAVRIMREQRQVVPCYAGISNVHINFDGGVWPCCVLGYGQEMGSLRDSDYDFQKVWHSDRARDVRKFIGAKKCACPLANQAYSNILCSPAYLFRALHNLLRG